MLHITVYSTLKSIILNILNSFFIIYLAFYKKKIKYFKIFLNALKMAYLNINHPSHLATSPQSIHPFKKLNLKLPFIN